jgi:hypothetical protein
MGWNFRKSFTLGPFRVNFSKSGISYSFGMFGWRTGVNAKGKRYSSMSIPGTGVSWRGSGSGKKKTKKKSETETEE